MITCLNDAIAYSHELAERFPSLANEVRLPTSGYDDKLIEGIRREVPDLPDSYIDVLLALKVQGRFIGDLNLWPSIYRQIGILESLKEANSNENNPHLSLYRDKKLIEVGSFESYPVCIGESGNDNEGCVFLVDVVSSVNPDIENLAASFEQLIVIACNFHKILLDIEGDPDLAEAELVKKLDNLNLEKDCYKAWKRLLLESL